MLFEQTGPQRIQLSRFWFPQPIGLSSYLSSSY
jgi:hypothetical protein